jgi:heptosyltransferase III
MDRRRLPLHSLDDALSIPQMKLTLAQQEARAAVQEDFERILFVVPAQLGDVLLCTPALRAAKVCWPNARTDVIGFAGTTGLVEGNPDVTAVVELKPSASSGLGRRVLELLRLWRRYDLALVARSSDRAHLAGWIAGRRRSVLLPAGPSGEGLKRRIADHHAVEAAGTHVVLRNLALLTPWIDLPHALSLRPPPELALPDWLDVQLRPTYVVVHVPSMWRYKQWPVTHFRFVVDSLLRDGVQVVLTGSDCANDQALLAPLLDAGREPELVNAAGRLRLRQLVPLLRRAAAYLGPDSSTTHLAAAVGAPVVTMYGPSRPDHFGPWPGGHGPTQPWSMRAQRQQVDSIVILQGPDRHDRPECVPCNGMGCDGHRHSRSRCLEGLAPSRVLRELRRLLEATDLRTRPVPRGAIRRPDPAPVDLTDGATADERVPHSQAAPIHRRPPLPHAPGA